MLCGGRNKFLKDESGPFEGVFGLFVAELLGEVVLEWGVGSKRETSSDLKVGRESRLRRSSLVFEAFLCVFVAD